MPRLPLPKFPYNHESGGRDSWHAVFGPLDEICCDYKTARRSRARFLLRRQVKRRHSIGTYLLPPPYFFCFSLHPHAIYYLRTLRLYTQSCRFIRSPSSKTPPSKIFYLQNTSSPAKTTKKYLSLSLIAPAKKQGA
jgi:hypothetical protein